MDVFHKDFTGFLVEFNIEIDRTARLMKIIQATLLKHGIDPVDTKELYDMVNDMRYGAEKAYKISNNIEEEDSFYFSKDRVKEIVKEQMLEALKAFWLDNDIVIAPVEDAK